MFTPPDHLLQLEVKKCPQLDLIATVVAVATTLEELNLTDREDLCNLDDVVNVPRRARMDQGISLVDLYIKSYHRAAFTAEMKREMRALQVLFHQLSM